MTAERKLAMRAAVNEWISDRFPDHRMLLSHEAPVYEPSADAWNVTLTTKRNGVPAVPLGVVVVAHDGCIVVAPEPAEVLAKLPDHAPAPVLARDVVSGDWWDFRHGDGIAAAAELPDRSIDLLLTDPPYGISQRYTCETQVPRRLRKDGSDFIMPKGHFGDWDIVNPHEWTESVLPKVGGWAVTFCAQAQIGIYTDIFTDHGFVAVGPMVWQKTNPVPFNHRYKPVNAWEAVMVGKWHCRQCEHAHVGSTQIAGGSGIQGLQRGTALRPGLHIESGDHLCLTCGQNTRQDRWQGHFAPAIPSASMPASFVRRAVRLLGDRDIQDRFQLLKKSNGSVSHNLLKSRAC